MTMEIQRKTFEVMDRHGFQDNVVPMPDREYAHSMALKPGPNVSKKPSFWHRWRDPIEIGATWGFLVVFFTVFWIVVIQWVISLFK